MTEAGEKWVMEVHKKRGFPVSPAWHVQADHYIRAFVAEVENRAKERQGNSTYNGLGGFFQMKGIILDELTRELLGD